MIAAHHGELEYGAIKKPSFMEVYLLHTLDMMDANVEKLETILEDINPGEFDIKPSFDGTYVYNPIINN